MRPLYVVLASAVIATILIAVASSYGTTSRREYGAIAAVPSYASAKAGKGFNLAEAKREAMNNCQVVYSGGSYYRDDCTAKSMTTPRTRADLLPKAHSASSANLLALVLSKSALISCQSFPCSLSYANPATFICLRLRCSSSGAGSFQSSSKYTLR
jgi:hypothetical protein